MELKEYFELIKEFVRRITECIDQGDGGMAFHLYKQEIGVINGFVMFLEENNIISVPDIEEMVGFLIQAMENEDVFLLRDVLNYAIIDIVSQLEGEVME